MKLSAPEEMKQVFARIKELTKLCYAHEQHIWRGVKNMELPPPAQDKDIQRFNETLPHPLPPSYITFLKLHNGCVNFWPRYQLMGAKGKAKEIVDAALQENRLYQTKRAIQNWMEKEHPQEPPAQFQSRDELVRWLTTDQPEPEFDKNVQATSEQIALYESWSPNPNCHHLFLPKHTVFGTDEGGTFLLFNEKEVGSEGEYQVIYYSYDIGVKETYKNFPEFLLQTLKELEERVVKKRYAKKKK